MYSSFRLFALAFLAFVVYKIARTIVESIIFTIKRKRRGCELPREAATGFLGLKVLKRIQKADKDWLVPDFLETRYNELTEEFGRPAATFRFNMLGHQLVHTTDPLNIKAMLATQFDDFCLGDLRSSVLRPTLGAGIFTQDGKDWEHARAMLRPNFVRDQVADLKLEETHLQNMIRALPVSPASDGWTADTDMQTLFFRLTLDSATEFLFGQSVNSQVANLPAYLRAETDLVAFGDEMNFAKDWDNAQHHLASRMRYAMYYWIHNPKDFRDSNKRIHAFVDRFVNMALQKSTPEKASVTNTEKPRYVFLDSLVQQTRNPIEIRNQLLNTLLAGRDTTASLLSYLFHHLIRNQDVLSELRETIISEFGTYDNPKNITFSSLKGCTYLHHCLNETLRINTVVPGNLRMATRDTTLPRGGGKDGTKPVFIPKGMNVEYAIHNTHRRKDLWGPDSYEFKPSRWVGRKTGWEFLPFNGGPRICIGQQFAIIEASYVVVRLLQRFDGIVAAGDELTRPVTANVTLTACPGKGPIVRLHEAPR